MMENAELSILVPTHFRDEKLPRLIGEIQRQMTVNDELIIGVTSEDINTRQLLAKKLFNSNLVVSSIVIDEIGVVSKINQMVKIANKNWIVLIDDDALPKENWLLAIKDHISRYNSIVFGGPDIQEKVKEDSQKVGYLSTAGRLIGNHEKGRNFSGEVEFVKGANMVVNRNLFPIDSALSFKGAEPHWEIFLCNRASLFRQPIRFDSQIVVFHEPGNRMDIQRETNPDLAYVYNRNLLLSYLLNKKYMKAFKILLYQTCVGRSPSYGVLRLIFGITLRREKDCSKIFLKAIKGSVDALIENTRRL